MAKTKESAADGGGAGPAGGVKAPKEEKFAISIFPSWCKDCGICAEFCKKKVFDRDLHGTPLVSRPADCTGCQECVLHCPDFAITVTRKKS